MKHFHRTSLDPDAVLALADAFFPTIGLAASGSEKRARRFAGPIGRLALAVTMEAGHYTFIEAHTDQMGESRLDRNVKKFFVQVHREADPNHRLEAAY